MHPDETEDHEYIVTATVKLRGAWMSVMASSEAEARKKAEAEPDFAFELAEMSDWTITNIERA